MRIENIIVDRFGSHTGLQLPELSSQINVVYGADGSGKSSTMAFIRWMLFGNCDQDTDRYLQSTSGPSAGSLSVFHDGLRRTISRQDDGTRYGLLSVDAGTRFTQQTNHMVSLLGNLGLEDYDALYASRHAVDVNIVSILRAAQARGLSLTGRRVPDPRVPELRLKIDNIRRDMDRLPWRASDVHALHEQRRSLADRLSILEDEYSRRRSDYEREYEQISGTVSSLELELSRIRQQWHEKDEQAQLRRRELEEAWRAADEAKQEFLRRRRDELASIESSITRARSMQTEVRSRFERVDKLVRDAEHDATQVPHDPHTSCLVSSIATQLDQLRSAPKLAYDPVTGRYRPVQSSSSTTPSSHAESTLRYPYPSAGYELAPGMGTPPRPFGEPDHSDWARDVPTLDHLRQQVGKLCRTLQENESQKLVSELTSELNQLEQCDVSMEQWIDSLTKQRDVVAADLERAQLNGVALVADTPDGDLWLHRGEVAGELRAPERIKAVPHACDSYQPIEPEQDVLLRRLVGERDAIQKDVEAHERQLRQLLERRRELETAISRITDLEKESVRRQIHELDALIRTAEDRERMQREIETLEAELRRRRDDLQPSEVIQQASEWLRRISANRLVSLRVEGSGGLLVEDDGGREVLHTQMPLPEQQQVALALMLAIVNAYRVRGMELPLILSDRWFIGQPEQGQGLAATVAEFAEAGNQVIVFTKYRHLIGSFQPFRARIFELLSNITLPVDEPPLEPQADAVRFRPRVTEPSTPQLRGRRSDPDHYRPSKPSQTRSGSFNPPQNSLAGPVVTGSGQSDDATPFTEMTGVSSVDPGARENDYPSASIYPSSVGTDHANQIRQVFDSPPTPVSSSSPLSSGTETTTSGPRLTRSTLLANAQTVDADVVSRLSELAIITVDDFLNASPATVDRELQQRKLGVRPVRRWQDELLLRCNVSNVGAVDAPLIVAAGVTDVQILADCEVESLVQRLRRVVELQGSAESFYIEPGRVANWIQEARRRISSRRAVGSLSTRNDGASPSQTRENGGKSAGEYLRGWRESSKQRRPRRRRKNKETTQQSPLPDERVAERVRRRRQEEAADASAQPKTQTDRKFELKFYLDRQSPVVDAPSIGPRTAERLQGAGIYTIDELIQAVPEALAARLEYNRVNAETIREWQAQSILACRIPMLRGHDAQILVACGITTPEKLAEMTVEQLWATIGPFTTTNECKRIIRNGRTPDRNEAYEWITWAARARSLQAS